MQFETLAVSLQDHIATVRLNRPDKANAMNAAMWQDIRRAFQWVDETPEARVAVLQGEGKLCTAGIDLQMMMGLGPQIQNDCDGRTREALRRVNYSRNGIGLELESSFHFFCGRRRVPMRGRLLADLIETRSDCGGQDFPGGPDVSVR